MIVDANGLIITNNHVVNKADEIKVFWSDKRESQSRNWSGTDAKTDVAVLRIEATGLPTVAWLTLGQVGSRRVRPGGRQSLD